MTVTTDLNATTAPPACETFVPVDGAGRLFVRTIGSGEPVLVPMAYPCKEYEPLARRRQVVFYDPRGRGRSDDVDLERLTFEQDVEDVERVRLALRLETMAIVGWSYLGAVAARYAMRYPSRVSRLALVASTGVRNDVELLRTEQTKRLNAAVPRLMKRLKADGVIPPAEGRALTYAMVVTRSGHAPPWPGMQHEHFLDQFTGGLDPRRRYFNTQQHLIRTLGDWDWRADGRKITAPVLVVYGAGDLLPHHLCTEWVAALPASRGLLMSGVGHFPSLEDPDRLLAAVDEFLDGRWPAGSFANGESSGALEHTEGS